MNIRKVGLAVCCALLLLQAAGGRAAMAEDLPAAAPKQVQTNFTDTSLLGGITYTQQFFQVESYWSVKAVELHLDYKVSQLMQNERSSVTVYINNVPFYSFRPDQAETVEQQLTLAVPVEHVIEGVNTLMVQGHLETTAPVVENACLPTDTRDNWLQIAKTSRVNVQYDDVSTQTSIRDFNARFIGLDTVKNGENALAVPAAATPAELEAATYALSGFAKANQVGDKPVPLVPYGNDTLQGKQAVVLIALYENLPDEAKALIPAESAANKAVLQLASLGGRTTLLITSSDAGLLVKAGRFAANQGLLGQIDADRKEIDTTTEVDTPPVSVSRNLTLTESGDKLVGDRHRERAFFISLPGNRSIADASKLSIHYRYARNLDFDRSMVTILINDTPIGSKRLSTEMADSDHIDLTIPKTLNISGNFSVKVAFDLELKNANCIENQEQMPWAFIEKDSLLQLNTKDRADLLFNNYPYPLLRDGSYNQVAVVLPAQRDLYLYQTLTNLFNLLGRYAQTNTGEVLYYEDTVNAVKLKGREIIAIGGFKDNAVIRNNNDKLYFSYDDSGQGFVSNEKMSIEANYGRRIGTLQLIDSPYESGFGLLAVTGSSPEFVYLASKLIGSEGTLWKVFGDGAVTDKDGNVQAFRFKKQAEAAPSTNLGDIVERKDVLGFMAAAMLVAVLVLVSLIFLVRKYSRKRRDRR
ncbi:cellulose biosynthesis cyclic di-GMP-binding regulatory protein BcsB [Paenibacillus athensensis]|uniref:Cellulose synthase n=1 Tax=Paenibacillus athensensis TaxID=1967502 RepID=A0A4Y8Q9D7_9BACL|nr:cellulose biosynthesis cyclic di-GMP-binding regulatory protein BcsB [Paenibacillus athensensis]MCD1257310.1 cellulose biosynthesis cyclic di-GMP-binding regulatory protein BcsB [Paenibacillus athensensis]